MSIEIPDEIRQAVLRDYCARHGGHSFTIIESGTGPVRLVCDQCERTWSVIPTLTDEAIQRLTEDIVTESQAVAGGCCQTPEWRNHLCQYHQGMDDGADAVLRAIEPKP